jgi:L-fuconolactonase
MVDAHAHVFPADAGSTLGLLAGWRGDASAAALLRAMDGAGVERAVLAPVGPDPAHVLECRAGNPRRFGAVTLVPRESAGSPARPRCEGVRLNRLGRPGATSLRELDTAGLLRSLAASGQVLSFFGARDQLRNLEVVLRELPQLAVMVNHLGAPLENFGVDERGRPSLRGELPLSTLALMQRYARYPMVTVAVSGLYALSHQPYPYPDLRATVEQLAASYGPGRLLWASDFPWTSEDPGYGETLAVVDRQLPGLDAGERSAILGGNARRVFGRPDPARATPMTSGPS